MPNLTAEKARAHSVMGGNAPTQVHPKKKLGPDFAERTAKVVSKYSYNMPLKSPIK